MLNHKVKQGPASSFRGNMQKISLELPKFRLELHAKLVKRRKPLVSEPILPTKADVNKKYRTGTFTGRLVRYFADHKAIRKVFATNFAIIAVVSAFTPQTTNIQAEGYDSAIIESQTTLFTEKGMQYPVQSIKINQGYGFFHPGLDLGGPKGTPIKPIMPGVVAYAGWDRSGYGNLVVLTHKNGFDSYYAHLSKIEVKTGDIVDMNTKIGEMGVTGRTTGSHLHLEIHQKGVSLNPLTILSR
jgi:murein DD-endopeptidase MepM/ murein hydrolase activator NlpD